MTTSIGIGIVGLCCVYFLTEDLIWEAIGDAAEAFARRRRSRR